MYDKNESRSGVYAIVRSGGRQHKVAVGDVVEIDKVADEAGSSIELTPLLVVDGESVTSDKDALGKVKVTAEVLGETKGCLLYTSPSPRDGLLSRMPSSA